MITANDVDDKSMCHDVKSDEKIQFFSAKVLQMYRNGAIIMLYNCIKPLEVHYDFKHCF